jgi:hypothetical protein
MANDALTASFGLDIAPLTQSLNRATSAVASATAKMGKSGFSSLVSPIAGVVSSIGTVAGIMEGLKGSLDLGGELNDISNKTGIGTGALYELKLMGKDAGLAIDDIAGSINKLQKGLGKSESDSVLRELGLDPQQLAKAKPEKAFEKIGLAIANLKNPTAQVQAAIALFGKSGAAMLQLFNDPSFKAGIGSSQASQIMEKNSAIFDKMSDSLGHIKPRITEFFAGFNSENAANLERIANAIDRLDLTQKGVDIGNIVGTFSQAIAEGQFGKMLLLSVEIAAKTFINNMISGALAMGRALYETIELLFRPETWKAFGNSLMSFVNSFNATLMHGIGMLLEQLEKAPVVGKYFKGAAAATNGLGDQFAMLSANQSATSANLAGGLYDDVIAKIKASFDWGKVFNTDDASAQLQELTDSIYNGLQAANQKAREEADKNKRDGSNNAATVGVGAKASIIADSLAKVGGGGNAIGPGSNPILEENKRQTSLLASINQGILKAAAQTGPIEAQFKLN